VKCGIDVELAPYKNFETAAVFVEEVARIACEIADVCCEREKRKTVAYRSVYVGDKVLVFEAQKDACVRNQKMMEHGDFVFNGMPV